MAVNLVVELEVYLNWGIDGSHGSGVSVACWCAAIAGWISATRVATRSMQYLNPVRMKDRNFVQW